MLLPAARHVGTALDAERRPDGSLNDVAHDSHLGPVARRVHHQVLGGQQAAAERAGARMALAPALVDDLGAVAGRKDDMQAAVGGLSAGVHVRQLAAGRAGARSCRGRQSKQRHTRLHEHAGAELGGTGVVGVDPEDGGLHGVDYVARRDLVRLPVWDWVAAQRRPRAAAEQQRPG